MGVLFSAGFDVLYFVYRHLVGIIANQGELTEEASTKGCHFVQMCAERNIPLVFLQNTVPETQTQTQNTGIKIGI